MILASSDVITRWDDRSHSRLKLVYFLASWIFSFQRKHNRLYPGLLLLPPESWWGPSSFWAALWPWLFWFYLRKVIFRQMAATHDMPFIKFLIFNCPDTEVTRKEPCPRFGFWPCCTKSLFLVPRELGGAVGKQTSTGTLKMDTIFSVVE